MLTVQIGERNDSFSVSVASHSLLRLTAVNQHRVKINENVFISGSIFATMTKLVWWEPSGLANDFLDVLLRKIPIYEVNS